MRLSVKIVFSILISILILFVGLIAVIVSAVDGGSTYNGGSTFRPIMVAAAFAVAWLFALAQIWGLLKPKIRYVALAAAVGVMAVSAAAYQIYRIYDDDIAVIHDQGVDLTLYDPFRENTLAASLSEPPTLSLAGGDLPRLDGATALYPVYAAFARAVYPSDVKMAPNLKAQILLGDGTGVPQPAAVKPDDGDILACSNTDGSFRRLIAGQTDVIFIARPSEGQRQMAAEAGVELRLTPVGREAFVFFVNAKNPVRGLSVGDIRRIYSGDAVNWREFGGGNSKIRAFQRPENSGSQTALVGFMGDTPLMTPPKRDVAGGMGDIIGMVSEYKNYDNAIGYSFLFYATEMVNDNEIKLLELDGIAPTRESVADGSYPYASEFYAVTAGTDNPNAEKLIEWILGPQGQELVSKTGYTPLPY